MKEMTFIEHLEDLKKTVVRVSIILIGTFFVTYAFSSYISSFLLRPIKAALAQTGGTLIVTGLFDRILAELLVTFWASLVLSSPLWFYELWRFIKPALYEGEVKVVRPFLLFGFFLFVSGVCFGYFLVFPNIFPIILQLGVDANNALNAYHYLSLSSKLLAMLGIIFQLPNALLILGFMGLVTKYSLRSWRRYVYVVLAIVSAVLTPPDPFTMLVMWVPLVILYEIGIWAVAAIVHPYLEKKHS